MLIAHQAVAIPISPSHHFVNLKNSNLLVIIFILVLIIIILLILLIIIILLMMMIRNLLLGEVLIKISHCFLQL